MKYEKIVSLDMAILAMRPNGFKEPFDEKKKLMEWPADVKPTFFTVNAGAKGDDKAAVDDSVEREMLVKVIRNAIAVYAMAVDPDNYNGEVLKRLINRVTVS